MEAKRETNSAKAELEQREFKPLTQFLSRSCNRMVVFGSAIFWSTFYIRNLPSKMYVLVPIPKKKKKKVKDILFGKQSTLGFCGT